MFAKAEMEKNIKRNLVDYSIITDLKNIEMNPQTDDIFKNVIDLDFSVQQIMQNKVISFSDAGFLYSLLCLAYQDRSKMMEDIKWSSKM